VSGYELLKALTSFSDCSSLIPCIRSFIGFGLKENMTSLLKRDPAGCTRVTNEHSVSADKLVVKRGHKVQRQINPNLEL